MAQSDLLCCWVGASADGSGVALRDTWHAVAEDRQATLTRRPRRWSPSRITCLFKQWTQAPPETWPVEGSQPQAAQLGTHTQEHLLVSSFHPAPRERSPPHPCLFHKIQHVICDSWGHRGLKETSGGPRARWGLPHCCLRGSGAPSGAGSFLHEQRPLKGGHPTLWAVCPLWLGPRLAGPLGLARFLWGKQYRVGSLPPPLPWAGSAPAPTGTGPGDLQNSSPQRCPRCFGFGEGIERRGGLLKPWAEQRNPLRLPG